MIKIATTFIDYGRIIRIYGLEVGKNSIDEDIINIALKNKLITNKNAELLKYECIYMDDEIKIINVIIIETSTLINYKI